MPPERTQALIWCFVVGVAGFEPAASSSRRNAGPRASCPKQGPTGEQQRWTPQRSPWKFTVDSGNRRPLRRPLAGRPSGADGFQERVTVPTWIFSIGLLRHPRSSRAYPARTAIGLSIRTTGPHVGRLTASPATCRCPSFPAWLRTSCRVAEVVSGCRGDGVYGDRAWREVLVPLAWIVVAVGQAVLLGAGRLVRACGLRPDRLVRAGRLRAGGLGLGTLALAD